jgi:hypothetical protein
VNKSAKYSRLLFYLLYISKNTHKITMPQKNEKQLTIELLEKHVKQQNLHASDREFFDEEDSLEDERDRRTVHVLK